MQCGINTVVLCDHCNCIMLLDYELELCGFTCFVFCITMYLHLFFVILTSTSCMFSSLIRTWSSMEGRDHMVDGACSKTAIRKRGTRNKRWKLEYHSFLIQLPFDQVRKAWNVINHSNGLHLHLLQSLLILSLRPISLLRTWRTTT